MKHVLAKYREYLKYFKMIFGFGLMLVFFAAVSGQDNLKIINFHEHIESTNEARQLIKIMEKGNMTKVVLLGSPNYTLYLAKNMGFEEYDKNNQEILDIAKRYPDRFVPFVTLNPLDEDNLSRFKDYISQGAMGLKLYYGSGENHGKGPFHVINIDDPRMDSVFEYIQKKRMPIVFHINLNKYYPEFVSLMEKFPNLKIIVPHFMLSMRTEEGLTRVEKLFEQYPNLYTDISFGRPKFLTDGLAHISENPELYRNFIIKNKERFLFGTDMVITKEKFNSGFPISENIKVYQDFLEKKRYQELFSGKEINGLYLDKETLRIIYQINPLRLLAY